MFFIYIKLHSENCTSIALYNAQTIVETLLYRIKSDVVYLGVLG